MTELSHPSCAICEADVNPSDRQSIRLSSSQPPWSARSASSAIALLGQSFAATVRAMHGEPEITVWFHRECWHRFRDLLGAPPS
jgi:hypothetical protein